MSAEVRRRAFDPFFTTKLGKGGSGLGLNIVYNIATGVLGGEVELQSAPGQGSRFVFRLPLRAPQRAEPASAMQPSKPA
jgi:signal transduction histidine kinase